MNKSTAIRTTVAASVAAAGLTVGGIGLASAADDNPSSSPSGTTADHRHGPGGPGFFDTEEVTAALDELHEAREAEARSVLSDRLDEAVEAGDLTDEDKESVLKAFDAGVLGGPFGHHGPS